MQLSRILTAPLVVDVRRGAVAGLGALLADQRIATEGRVAVAVGPSQGDSVLADLAPENLGAAEVFRVEDSTVDAAVLEPMEKLVRNGRQPEGAAKFAVRIDRDAGVAL